MTLLCRVDSDIEESLHFLLEDEAADILDNAQGGLQAIWKLENRYNTMSRSKRLPPKNVGDMLGAIERWEERIQRLAPAEQPTNDMQVALIGRLCTPKIK